jgi:GNAT superfamily N-acetyltransferase
MNASKIPQAIEGNLFELYRTVAEFSKKPIHIGPNVSWVNFTPSPWAGTIFGADFSASGAGKEIQSVKEQIRLGNAPRSWRTGPSTRPKNLEEHLIREGFVKKWETAGMGMELSDSPSNVETPPGLEIENVSNDLALREWAWVVTLGLFNHPESEADHFYELMHSAKGCGRLDFFLGRYEGRPATSSASFLADGIAGIYFVATLSEFRRRDIGRSVTLAPLLTAKTLGVRAAILQATLVGEIVYRPLGFRTICTLGRYRLVD